MEDKYYAWDYVSLLFEMEPDRFHTYLETLEALGEKHIGSETWKRSTKVRVLGAKDATARRYAFSAWGRAARVIAYLPRHWSCYVRRIDAKLWDCGISEDQANILASHLFTHPNSYNITAINSKPRVKTDDRDAGGKGFAIGSHHSDLRVSVYRRNDERFCQEFQCRDKMLKRFIEAAHQAEGRHADDLTFWLRIKDYIQAAGEQRYNRALYCAGIGDYVPTQHPNGTGEAFEALDETGKDDTAAYQHEMPLDHQWDPGPQGEA